MANHHPIAHLEIPAENPAVFNKPKGARLGNILTQKRWQGEWTIFTDPNGNHLGLSKSTRRG